MSAGSLGAALSTVAIANASIKRFEREIAIRRMQRKAKREERKEKLKLKLDQKELEILEEIDQQLHVNRIDKTDKPCPECQQHMSRVTMKDTEIDYCLLCKGCWFDPGELKVFSGLSSDHPAEDLKSRASRFPCPVCGEDMREHVFIRSDNLLVDRCPNGHGIYLENGEFERVLLIN